VFNFSGLMILAEKRAWCPAFAWLAGNVPR